MTFTFETGGEGLRKVLRDYEEESLRHIWSMEGRGAGSREVWEHVNEALRGARTVSRASIIMFLDSMAEEGFVECRDVSSKGGGRGFTGRARPPRTRGCSSSSSRASLSLN